MLEFWKNRGRTADRAAGTDDVEPQRPSPSIGLALGGGAARGFAHVGVIRTLLSKGIRPDVICGTSMGAVVAGAYAADRLEAFETWARSLTSPRRVLSYLDLSLTGSGLINGSRLAARIEEAVGRTMIEDLPVRLAAIATEIGTGHEIWLTRGRLADALRASYALPGIFAPVRVGGRWLVDGALTNPVPVAAARALGARLVIAVNVNADLFGRGATISSHGSDQADDVLNEFDRRHGGLRGLLSAERMLKRQLLGQSGRPGISTVMLEAFNIMQDRITRARLAGDPPDVLVQPRLGSVGLFDFQRAEEMIALGSEATERALEPLAEALAALT